MELKLYLNKFLKVDNIEKYTMTALDSLKKEYDKYIEKSDGKDPDFPELIFGEQGTKINSGKNIYELVPEGKTVEEFKRENNIDLLESFRSGGDFRNLAPDEERKLTRQSRSGNNYLK